MTVTHMFSQREQVTERKKRRHHCHKMMEGLKLGGWSMPFELRSEIEDLLGLGLTPSSLYLWLSVSNWREGGIMIHSSQASFRATVGNSFYERPESKHLRLPGPYELCCNYSTLPLWNESSHRISERMSMALSQ